MTSIDGFSLQLNTQFFKTSVCNGAVDPAKCRGWQQFIYSNSGFIDHNIHYGQAFMQYWLLGFGPCPSGWNTFESDCWKNSDDAVSVPFQTIAELAVVTLRGSTTNAADTVAMSVGSNLFSASGQDSILNLQQGWQVAEFNIIGDGDSSQSHFNKGSTLVVRTSVDDGTTNAPNCVTNGFTGETNNLSLVRGCCPYGGTSPAIVFTESNAPGATPACGAIANIAAVQYVLQQSDLRRRVGALESIIEYTTKSLR